MESLIPKRLEVVNATSAYSFFIGLARFFPDGFKREQIEADKSFFGKYSQKSRPDFIKAHLDYGMGCSVIRSVNNHFEFADNENLATFFSLVKEGKKDNAKRFFAKFLEEKEVVREFLQAYRSKRVIKGVDVKSFLESHFPNHKSFTKMQRFFVNILFQAGIILEYDMRKQRLVFDNEIVGRVNERQQILNVKQSLAQKTTGDSMQEKPTRQIKDYIVAIKSPQGEIKEYSFSFSEVLEIASDFEKRRGARQGEK